MLTPFRSSLYQKACFLSFRRGKRTQTEGQALLAIQGCADRKDSHFYHGKRVAFIYRAKDTKRNVSHKAIWGRVTTSHGNGGVVRATFAKNLPPKAMGCSTLRVMLYPNKTIWRVTLCLNTPLRPPAASPLPDSASQIDRSLAPSVAPKTEVAC